MSEIRKSAWIIIGTVCMGLGILGVFLPVLPTTPFLLLTAFCYGRGSERFYHWLMDRSPFGGYIRNYQEGRGIPLKHKVLAIAVLWLTIGLTLAYVATTWWMKILLMTVAVGVTLHLGKVKTLLQDIPGPVDLVNPAESADIS